jgi:hypothetical protein
MAHATPKLKFPVPSPLKLPLNPARPPVTAFVGIPVAALMMFNAVAPDAVLLNLKSCWSADPVSTNLFASDKTTSKLTDVPLCVSVTVPNDVAVPHPPVTWHDVKVKMSA